MNSKAHSIRWRLLALLSLAVLLVSLIQAALAYRVALDAVDDLSDYHMTQIALAVRRGALEPTANALLQRPISGEEVSFRVQTSPAPAPTRPPEEEDPQRPARGFSTLSQDGRLFRVFTAYSRSQKIEVLQDMAARTVSARGMALRSVVPSLLLLPVLLLSLFWGISRSLRPLLRSRDEVSTRDANDLKPLKTEGVPLEILPFIDEINVLFKRISKAFATQQSFVADAAHELRSPLAALRIQVQALQRASTPESSALAAERVLAGIDRATRLVEQLLQLARHEAPEQADNEVFVPDIVRLALADVYPLAQARQIEISGLDWDENMPAQAGSVRGNVEALRVLLRNLLDNAIKYTPPGGQIALHLLREQQSLSLRIDDSGPGIAAEQREAVFERFCRGAGHEVSGSGLGLAIVRAIAEQQHVRVDLGQAPQLGGLSVALRFALSAPRK